MAYNQNSKYHLTLDRDVRQLAFYAKQENQGTKRLFKGSSMALQRKSVTPVIYYEYSLKHRTLYRVQPYKHHSKWFTAGIAVTGLTLAWWLNQSNASYDKPLPEHQMLGFDASSLNPANATFPTPSDVFFNRMDAEIDAWIQQAKPAAAKSTSTPKQNSEANRALHASLSIPSALPDNRLEALKLTPPTPVANVAEPATGIVAKAPIIKDQDGWQMLTVEQGDTLSSLFNRYAIPQTDMHNLLKLKDYRKDLTHLQRDQTLWIKTNAEGNLTALKSKLNYHQDLLIETAENDIGFRAKVLERPINTRLVGKAGVIENSLFADARNAGVSSKKILELTKIFNWDIDFSEDLHKGDQFSLVYETLYSDGNYVKEGAILAAEFINQGKHYQAVRYTDPSGHTAYYSPDGHSLQKAFMRNPVKAVNITSKFNLARYHPILHQIRAHKGVDYGAPVGTPVYAAGAGTVVFAGRKNGYGNVVMLQHWDKYSTLYAHLSGFAKGLKVGQKVAQEQAIGYVGQTGLATAPHLHYEFRIDGEHKDPLTVKLPQAIPIDKAYKKDFLAQTHTLMAKLEEATEVALAQQ